MCGICGLYYFKSGRPVDERQLVQMRDSLIHRGPDDAGTFIEGEIGLAMRRLSIIDLVTGSQPIWNETQTIAVVYNGEIYNYKELGQELENHGHIFHTRSDTEVIVHAYEQYGDECVTHFQGMFAFAIWDGQHKRLLLARDRFGIKPLFYAMDKDGLLFGSEIKSILTAGFPRVLDTVALDQFFSHYYVPTPRTMFNDIRRLMPGHVLVCEQGAVRETEYWDLVYDPEPDGRNESCYIEGLREQLQRAVKRHLQSDVPLGAFLSGGLDSSTIIATMNDLVSEPVHTFTVGFPQASYDERSEARQVSNYFHTNHTEHVIELDWATFIPLLISAFDEPFGDYASIASYAVSKLAREYVKVVLSGDGGDEIFAGYPTHYANRVADLYRKVPAIVRKCLVKPLVERLPTSMDRISFDYMAKRFVVGAELPFQQGHYYWKVVFSETEKELLYKPAFRAIRQEDGDGYSVFERYLKKVTHLDPLSQLLYVDARTFLLDDNLTRVDRSSMMNSLEVRVPLLDDELVEFMRRVPVRIKQPGWGTKRLLRQAMKDILPENIVRGRKKGFTPPMPYWLRNELKEFMLDTLSEHGLAQLGILDEGYITHLVDEHLRGHRDNNRQLWSLITLMVWWETYQPILE